MSDELENDVASVVVRILQIDKEDQPTHWLWDRVMTCDVPRLKKYLSEEKIEQIEDLLA